MACCGSGGCGGGHGCGGGSSCGGRREYEEHVYEDTLMEILDKDDENNKKTTYSRLYDPIYIFIILSIIGSLLTHVCFRVDEGIGIIIGWIMFILIIYISIQVYNSSPTSHKLNEDRKKRVNKNRRKFNKYIKEMVEKRLNDIYTDKKIEI